MNGKRWLIVLLGAVAALALFLWRRGAPPREASPPPPAAAPAPSRPAAAPAPTPASVAGRVIDAGGAPIAGAVVRLVPSREREPAVTRTGADGRFQIGDLAPGRWSAGASADGFLPAHLDDLDLVAGKQTPLDLRLEPGGRPVSGTVSDRTGGAVAGAVVEITPLHGMLQARDRHSIAAVTDEAGRYRASVSEGRVRVGARHPDYVSDSRSVDVGAAGATVDFALLPGGVIEGVVREHGSGTPVPGAEVRFDREAVAGMPLGGKTMAVGRKSGSVHADDGGRFRVTGLEPGAIRLEARAARKASREPTVVSMAVAGQVTGVDVFVGGAYAVSGRVTYQGGEPAAGAEVSAFGPAARAHAVTDAAGRFTFEGLPPGNFALHASADDALPAGRLKSVDLRDKDVEGLELELARGAFVTGRVEPPELAEVALDVAQQLATPGRMVMIAGRASTLSARDGSFRLGPLPVGPARIGARASDGRRGVAEVSVAAEGASGVVIRLEERGAIAGRVVDEAGKPAVGAIVHVRPAPAESGPDKGMQMIVNGVEVSADRAPLGADGRYEVKGLEAGSYEVAVHGDDGEPLALAKEGKPARVTLKTNERRDGVDLVVEARDGVLKGLVLGPDGRPLADAWVTASVARELPGLPRGPGPGRGPRAVSMMMIDDDDGDMFGGGAPARALTREDGRFEIAGLRRGKYRLIGEGLGGAARGMMEGVETGTDVTLRLNALRKLEGTVTFQGKPVAELTVELEGPTSRQQTFRDAGGAFTIHRIDPGHYRVRVSAPEGGGQAEVDVPVEVTGPPATVTVALSANGRVVGKVLKADGSALAGAPVLTAPNTGDGRLMLKIEGEPPTTAPDGSFALDVAPGKHLLIVMADLANPGGPAVKQPFAVAAGQVVDLGALKANAAPPGP